MSEANAPTIYSLMAKVMAEVGAVTKERRNQAQNYNFRGIDDLYNALNGPLSRHGVFLVPKVLKLERTERDRMDRQGTVVGAMFYVVVTVRFTFYAPDGSHVSGVASGEGMDTGDKAVNKAMSGALKNMLVQTFCIRTDDPADSEYDNPQVASQQQANRSPSRTAPTEAGRQTSGRENLPAGRPQPPSASRNRPAGGAVPQGDGQHDPANDRLNDDAYFILQAEQAFLDKGFGSGEASSAMAAAIALKGVSKLEDFDLRQRYGFIEAIYTGRFDQHKKTPADATPIGEAAQEALAAARPT